MSKSNVTEFEKKLENLINCYSMENQSNTPDFILAEYLLACLKAFNSTVTKRDKWYGSVNKIERAVGVRESD